METKTKNIVNNGGYSVEDLIWHQHSNRLLIKILELWPDKSFPVFDLGCGHNWYANVMHKLGYMSTGWDTVYFPGVRLHDITKPLNFIDQRQKINILSLEVGEHIPSELAEGYFENLTRFGGHVIMSWAVPGQAGIGHINCQPNEWVAEHMLRLDYVIDVSRTIDLRQAVKDCHCSWFQNTLMYFIPKP